MKIKTQQILAFLKVLAWIAFFITIATLVSLLLFYISGYLTNQNNNTISNKIPLLAFHHKDLGSSIFMLIFIPILLLLKAIVWWTTATTISKIEVENPFTIDITHRLEYISYCLIAICLISVIGYGIFTLREIKSVRVEDWKIGSSFFMACLVFIISQIFKRGVEIQSENDLTV